MNSHSRYDDQAREVQCNWKGWQVKQTDTDEWLPVAVVPTNVHLDLIANNKIHDPFLGFNELDCQWVADKSWTYRVKLHKPGRSFVGQRHVLALDGLDTYASVRLDGRLVLQSDNMWHMHELDVTRSFEEAESKELTLEIEFASARLEARKVQDTDKKHKWLAWNGDPARLAARKAQYHWGWDWGPVLNTCGPWREIRLDSFFARITNVSCDYNVSPSLDRVSGTIRIKTDGVAANTFVRIVIRPLLQDQVVLSQNVEVDDSGLAVCRFQTKHLKLWYPYGYGEQSVYRVEVSLERLSTTFDKEIVKIGFRRVELIQEDSNGNDGIPGTSFYLRVNNIDMFCGGSCWIPADNFVTRVDSEKYRDWLELVVEGNQSMIRVWGGGIWENDHFYNACDDLGILVWQDFMFACGNYPASPAMLKSIEREGRDQLRRLASHPSIVLYAGNNEDYTVAESNKLTYNFEDLDPQNWLKTDFPARYIYEKLLPGLVEELAPHAVYVPGSPWSRGKPSTDPTLGDIHQWNVWHGTQEPYQKFGQLGGRFVSEFGMQALPHLATLKSYLPPHGDPSALHAQSRLVDFHNKAEGHVRRNAIYLSENLRALAAPPDLATQVHLSQLVQAEALSFALRDWRRAWGTASHRGCGGALVWQLNDCWPCTSWSLVDHHLRRKAAFYTVKRHLAPIAVGVRRELLDWTVGHTTQPEGIIRFQLWVVSDRTQDVHARVELRVISVVSGGEVEGRRRVWVDALLGANQTTVLEPDGRFDSEDSGGEPVVFAARVWVDGGVVARHVDWPQPLKYLEWKDRGVVVTQSKHELRVTAARPVKGLVFEERVMGMNVDARFGLRLGDNCLDVVPGDEQVVALSRGHDWTEDAEPLGWRYYGQDEA